MGAKPARRLLGRSNHIQAFTSEPKVSSALVNDSLRGGRNLGSDVCIAFGQGTHVCILPGPRCAGSDENVSGHNAVADADAKATARSPTDEHQRPRPQSTSPLPFEDTAARRRPC